MHLPKLTSAVALTALTFTLSAPPASSQNIPNQVSFVCRSIASRSGGLRTVPATVAFIPELRQHRRIIAWESDSFPNTQWTPRKRCEEISKKFQEFYNQGQLGYMTHGRIRGSGVICAPKFGETCNSKNQLFTVKPGSDPEKVLAELIEVARGQSAPVWQTADNNQRYLNFGLYLENALLADVTE
jgi:hypothetical protein